MRLLVALFLLLASCGAAAAQGCGSQNPNCIVPTAPVGTSDNRAASTAFVQQNVPGFLPAGVDANIANVQSSNYQIAPSDCGKTIFLNGTGLFTLTLPAITGFPTTCSVALKNGSNNGVVLSGFSADLGTFLYPKQSFDIKIVNGAWRSFYSPSPFSPAGGLLLYASASGPDSNDCLTIATACSLKSACTARGAAFINAGIITIELADGTYSAVDSTPALCSIQGNSGSSSNTLTFIIGDCTTPSNVVLSIPDGDIGIFTKDLGEVEVECLTLQGAGSGVTVGISGAQFSVVDLLKTVWGAFGSGSAPLQFTQSASLNFDGTAAVTINANLTRFVTLGSGANISCAGTIAIPSAVAWGSEFIYVNGNATANFAGCTFTGSGVAGTTGKRATLSGPGYLQTNTVACSTFFPGNGACTLTNGFQDDANDPNTTPLPAPTTTYAGLPGSPVAGMYAYISDGKSTNCGDSACTTWGTTVTAGAGALKLFIWFNGTNWTLAGK